MTGSRDDSPHDVLAAEEFGMGTGDPRLHREPAHDVLAADEFVLGVADPSLRRGPVRLPEEPDPSTEAHDVLAAEEFAVPAGRVVSAGAVGPGARGGRVRALAAGAGVLAAIVVRRRR